MDAANPRQITIRPSVHTSHLHEVFCTRARAQTRARLPAPTPMCERLLAKGWTGGRNTTNPNKINRLRRPPPGGRIVDTVDGGGDRTSQAGASASHRLGRDQLAKRP
ncbi:hypothetical protein CT3_28260 [Comamonas terrigena NBRC 13299]|nr:hypothetical protein CT3_28260 [Comamonas terrigena NBRC 13299]